MSDEYNNQNENDPLKNHRDYSDQDDRYSRPEDDWQKDPTAASDPKYEQHENRYQEDGSYRQPQSNDPNDGSYRQPQSNDSNDGSYRQQENNYQTEEPNGMATAALVFGIISIVSSCCCCATLPLAGLSIILAILSKGSAPRMSDRAKTGLGISIASICLTVLLTGASFIYNRTLFESNEFLDQFKGYMEYYENDLDRNRDEIDKMIDELL